MVESRGADCNDGPTLEGLRIPGTPEWDALSVDSGAVGEPGLVYMNMDMDERQKGK